MNETVFETIQESAEALRIDLTAQELAVFAEDRELTPEQLEAANQLFSYLAKKKHDKVSFRTSSLRHLGTLISTIFMANRSNG